MLVQEHIIKEFKVLFTKVQKGSVNRKAFWQLLASKKST